MTTLECKVTSCAHYQTGCCTLPSIHVTGANASVSNQTCCSSYLEKGKSAVMNMNGTSGHQAMNIHCDAGRCRHNCQGGCSASSVCEDSCGQHSASSCCETECSTFCCK